MISKLYMVIGAFIIALILMTAGAVGGYSYCKSSNYKGIIKQQTKDAKTILKHEDKKKEVKGNVDTSIAKFKTIDDPSGCLDTISPDDYIDKLLDADSAAKSGFD
ncbi:hypothetical protein KAR91_48065 [Candidatus Pacearchaeota archaeon]|nr:hypothetical protein [Candidatus Pacearchaeota archaeon]